MRLNYQNDFLVMALLLSSIAISIRSSDGDIKLVLHRYPVVIFLLVIVSSLFVTFYFVMNRRRIVDLSNQIKEQSEIKNTGTEDLINELTDRQREVYNLIIKGRSNKEIMADLFIEQSTLKSHINQIYKKMDIKNRRELKLKS